MKYAAVILAAGKGVRMRSELPKVVHGVGGKPMIKHVVDAVKKAGVDDITVVVGQGREKVKEVLYETGIRLVIQEEQLGTGHALMQAQDCFNGEEDILVLAGDTPLLQPSTIRGLMTAYEKGGAVAALVSATIENPFGYGRIVRNRDGSFARIVEEKDANADEKTIKEINSGMYCFKAREVFKALSLVKPDNAQGEYYLTEVLELLQRAHQPVAIYTIEDSEEIYGVNDRQQLSVAEAIIRRRKNIALMQSGVTIIDPASTFIDVEVSIKPDTIIYPFTFIEGNTEILGGCEIGPFTRIIDSYIGTGVHIENSVVKSSSIGDNCNIGPFAYLRPDTILHNGVKIGDFVEIKKSVLGSQSKVPHLSYVGDAKVGSKVNIGAGTITCNYDGKNKHETVIENGAFIGSNTNLVAPVRIGKNAYTGAGSTITRDVPDGALGVERAKQKNYENWEKRESKE
ncbi:MAG: bifunctional UDP-N-acetylglucosamine diphosphorylase/glucosamine-1-phosphate N-acetyltransferase GlmU [Syntrophomonadaceae bacterium]